MVRLAVGDQRSCPEWAASQESRDEHLVEGFQLPTLLFTFVLEKDHCRSPRGLPLCLVKKSPPIPPAGHVVPISLTFLRLHKNLHDLEQRAVEVEAVLLLLDPLMSRLSDRLERAAESGEQSLRQRMRSTG